MVDFASGLMSFATGAVKGGIEIQKRREQREDELITGAETDAATEVETMINDARAELRASQNLFNTTANNQIKNWNSIASEYGTEFQDDLSVLAVSRPDLFQGTDLEKIRSNVNNFMNVGPLGEEITPDSDVAKQFYQDYGQGATGSSVFKAQQDAYNAKVRNNMSQLVGSNSTKLLLDDYLPQNAVKGDQTFIRPEKLERVQEGKVSREAFLGNINELVNSEFTSDPASVSPGRYLSTVNWVPAMSMKDMRQALTAKGVTDPIQQNTEIMLQVAGIQRALELQGVKKENIQGLLLEKGITDTDNIMSMQSSVQPIVLANLNTRLENLSNSPLTDPTTKALILNYLNNKEGMDPESLRTLKGTLEEQLFAAEKEVRGTGYVDAVGNFIQSVDPEVIKQTNPQLLINLGSKDNPTKGIVDPKLTDGILSIRDYNQNIIGTMDIEDFFSPGHVNDKGEFIQGEKSGSTIYRSNYDYRYGESYGKRMRQIIYLMNGGQAEVQRLLEDRKPNTE
tara:strand:+ start:198 stop:1727 length:1530 start_codon:yes stop_codon:yes gene_type:complete